MATISGRTEERPFTIDKFLGLYESPDGDTNLKMGEASVMNNWKVTQDGNLKKRGGTKTAKKLTQDEVNASAPVQGLWTGYVNGEEQLIAACDGRLWRLWDAGTQSFIRQELGAVDTTQKVGMFGFDNKLYILNGKEYRQWDGTVLESVEGYRPLIAIEVTPDEGGTTHEQINKLTAKRRVYISPDGESATFHMPETELASIDYIIDFATGNELTAGTAYTYNLTNGTVTFAETPPQAVDSFEIGYTAHSDYRYQVEAMRFGEIFGGSTDSVVFLYGDGSNQCFYSGITAQGIARADYFPDNNVANVGESNTPITQLIRHNTRLIAFKIGSTYSITAPSVTDESSGAVGFYVSPVNRNIGNCAIGQVQQVNNNPITLHGNALYEWTAVTSYNSNITTDERSAKRISDKVADSLRSFRLEDCVCYDDNPNKEYYVCYDGEAVVHNYVTDTWYKYSNFPVACMVSFHDTLHIGTPDGRLVVMKDEYLNDDDEPIEAHWESGAMSFGKEYMKKYAAMLWVGLKPEAGGEVFVNVATDRKAIYAEKSESIDLFDFERIDFGDLDFSTNRQATMKRMKIKAKKFVFYKLIFECRNLNKTATVESAAIRVRFTGYAK